jgi:uncharacterized protein (AIM24 family)
MLKMRSSTKKNTQKKNRRSSGGSSGSYDSLTPEKIDPDSKSLDALTAVGNNEDNKVLILYIPYNTQIKFDPGTLVYYQNVEIDTNFDYEKRGGFFGMLFGMFTSSFTGEDFYHNTATNNKSQKKNGFVALSQTFPGNIIELEVPENGLIVNYGSFLACTDNVDITSRNNVRFSELFNIGSQETLVFPKVDRTPGKEGPFKVWLQGFGDIHQVELKEGETLNVDNERFFASEEYGDNIYNIKPSGGLKSLFFSQLGYVMEFTGPKTVFVQSKGIMTYLSELKSRMNIKK